MSLFTNIFKDTKPIIGMVHLLPLPSAPGYKSIEAIYERALFDLKALEEGKADALIIENFGDIPYPEHSELIAYTAFTSIVTRLKEKTSLPIGINFQFNDYEAEWAIAYACDVDFIRIEAFSENRMGPNGYFKTSGPDLMRLKERFKKDIALIGDVHVKHTFEVVKQPLDFTIEEMIEGGIDALICTGMTTGQSPKLEDVKLMKELSKGLPVIVGSGVNENTVNDFLSVADGAIIGSSFKKDGQVLNPIDVDRVKRLMAKIG